MEKALFFNVIVDKSWGIFRRLFLILTNPLFLFFPGSLNDRVRDHPSEFYSAHFSGCLRNFHVNGVWYPLTVERGWKGFQVQDCDGSKCGGELCQNQGSCQLDDKRCKKNNDPAHIYLKILFYYIIDHFDQSCKKRPHWSQHRLRVTGLACAAGAKLENV